MKQANVEKFFEILKNERPEPRTELVYKNPYTLLVAVVLSAQATDKGVNKATKKIFDKVDNPKDMVALGEAQLKKYINSIGLYNTKARNVIKLSEILLQEFEGKIPDTRKDLMKLPGVGRKTANVVLNVVFDQPTMAVDTHIFRVSNRTGLAPGKNPQEVEKNLLKQIPDHFLSDAHHWLILHGRYTCKARRPLCERCPVFNLCEFDEKEEIRAAAKS